MKSRNELATRLSKIEEENGSELSIYTKACIAEAKEHMFSGDKETADEAIKMAQRVIKTVEDILNQAGR